MTILLQMFKANGMDNILALLLEEQRNEVFCKEKTFQTSCYDSSAIGARR
jgi:hypothetical protein